MTDTDIRITRSIMISYRAWQKARQRANELNMSISRYIEHLVEVDNEVEHDNGNVRGGEAMGDHAPSS